MEGTFDGLVEAMGERSQEDSNSACMKALSELRTLTIKDGQSVAEFCLVLERLASRAFQNMPTAAVSLQKAEILYRQLANWNGTYNLAEALKKTDKSEVYEKVKEVALRLERNNRVSRNFNTANATNKFARSSVKPTVQKYATRPAELSSRDEIEIDGRGSSRPVNVSPRGNEGVQGAMTAKTLNNRKCYECGRIGHMAKQCQASKNHGPKVDAQRARPATAFPTPVESWVCATEEEEHIRRA
ncbi:unnamed protein product [Nippostrongylus brasiliensis]|uniref:CCHC-type domain-containing protein n=1 Tax=Nippostrongylus brasiliensis TaxID=27835 RepID=A0A0N4Y2B7_NIPBR|nr:unnamed protein product [Nippostrongylus brasiliensis]